MINHDFQDVTWDDKCSSHCFVNLQYWSTALWSEIEASQQISLTSLWPNACRVQQQNHPTSFNQHHSGMSLGKALWCLHPIEVFWPLIHPRRESWTETLAVCFNGQVQQGIYYMTFYNTHCHLRVLLCLKGVVRYLSWHFPRMKHAEDPHSFHLARPPRPAAPLPDSAVHTSPASRTKNLRSYPHAYCGHSLCATVILIPEEMMSSQLEVSQNEWYPKTMGSNTKMV